MTSQGSACARFRRALDGGNARIALAAAAELDFVSLPDALELVLLLVDEPGKFRRAAFRWHARYCADVSDVGFEEAQAVLACLAGLTGRRPKAAANALAELVNRRGLERASEFYSDGRTEPSYSVKRSATAAISSSLKRGIKRRHNVLCRHGRGRYAFAEQDEVDVGIDRDSRCVRPRLPFHHDS